MKGILFTADNLKKVIDGTKTVTRRDSGLKEINQAPDEWIARKHGTNYKGEMIWEFNCAEKRLLVKPRYSLNDIVYLKEEHYAKGEWRVDGFLESGRPRYEFHRAPLSTIHYDKPQGVEILRGHGGLGWYKRSPMFLEAKFARYFIQITDVSVGRVRDITEDDAIKEGIEQIPNTDSGLTEYKYTYHDPKLHGHFNFYHAVPTYFSLYDSIYGEGKSQKDWAFRYEYKLVPNPDKWVRDADIL